MNLTPSETRKTGFQNWAANEPDGHEYYVMMSNDGTWYDGRCDSIHTFILQW